MKLQLATDSLRLRIDERELEQLLDGRQLTLRIDIPGHRLFQLDTALGPDISLETQPHWSLSLPGQAVREYVRSLPRRDALVVPLPGMQPLTVLFEVDVRDSVRVRLTPQRS